MTSVCNNDKRINDVRRSAYGETQPVSYYEYYAIQ